MHLNHKDATAEDCALYPRASMPRWRWAPAFGSLAGWEGRYEEAIAQFAAALRIQPDDVGARTDSANRADG